MINSNGTVGEQYAERCAFPALGWMMTRTQPPTRYTRGARGMPLLVQLRSDGVPDYTGCDRQGQYTVCEVKECDDSVYPPRMPCSRLSKEQRAWMEVRAKIARCYVLVFWQKLGYGTLFSYRQSGSYIMGDNSNGRAAQNV